MKRHYFNSRPHGGRHENSEWTTSMFTFQLTPSRRATTEMWWAAQQAIFQLTPSRRATYFEGISTPPDGISTHALTEGDDGVIQFFHVLFHFNSRPHGGRRASHISLRDCADYFNSRPHGGRRSGILITIGVASFQLTPSRRATRRWNLRIWISHFNSRPHGGRPSPECMGCFR